MVLVEFSLALSLLTSVSAQYFPAAPKNVTIVKSKLQDGVSVSYKEVNHEHIHQKLDQY